MHLAKFFTQKCSQKFYIIRQGGILFVSSVHTIKFDNTTTTSKLIGEKSSFDTGSI